MVAALEVLTPDEVKEPRKKMSQSSEIELREVNPNWSAARKRCQQWKRQLKEKGLEINEDGTLRTEPKIDVNEITAKAESINMYY